MGTLLKKLLGLLPKELIWGILRDEFIESFVKGTETKYDDMGLAVVDAYLSTGKIPYIFAWELLREQVIKPFTDGTDTEWDDLVLESLDKLIKDAIKKVQ